MCWVLHQALQTFEIQGPSDNLAMPVLTISVMEPVPPELLRVICMCLCQTVAEDILGCYDMCVAGLHCTCHLWKQ